MRRRALALVCLFPIAACSEPVAPASPGAFAAVAGGFEHTCALLGGGLAYCWGRNTSFQLGTNRTNEHDSLPQQVSAPFPFTKIDAGQYHSCGLVASGAAYCWGIGPDGALGSDTATLTTRPIPVDGGLTFKAITLGQRHTCALTNAGVAYCWGDNILGQVGRDTTAAAISTPVPVAGNQTFSAIAAGDYHTCGIATDGLAYCWGDNIFGALGAADTIRTSKLPVAVAGNHHFRAIDGGNVHTCAVATNGEAWCWGAGGAGQLGNGARTDQFGPVRVTGSRLFGWISVGTNHSCALDIDAVNLYCWGSNGAGQLAGATDETCVYGPGPNDNFPCRSTPVRAAAGHYFEAVSAGGFHTCAIAFGGAAYCWGGNVQGQLGNGEPGVNAAAPVRVPDPHPVTPQP
jgi:alpha-tubulin suppressor-like RCC1 family protein